MLSKSDYNRYFEQIACLERQRIYRATDALVDLEDAYVLEILRETIADAKKRYGLIVELLRSKSLADSAEDKRLLSRRSSLGYVQLIFEERGMRQELAAYCVNFSHQGLCFESEHKVVTGTHYEARISLFDQPEPMVCAGKIVWVKEILPGFFKAGMRFDA